MIDEIELKLLECSIWCRKLEYGGDENDWWWARVEWDKCGGWCGGNIYYGCAAEDCDVNLVI